MFFVLWVGLRSMPRIIADKTGKNYVTFLGQVYYQKWNHNSPMNQFRMVRVENADAKTFVIDDFGRQGYAHDQDSFFRGEIEIEKK